MATKAIENRSEWTDWWPDVIPRRLLQWMDLPMQDPMRHGDHVLHVEEVEEDGNLVVRAEMPGMDPDKDIQVTLRDHTLELRAQRTQKETSEDKGVRRSEFRYGSFYRAVQLPADAKESDVHATYKDGILELRVPMVTTTEPPSKQIPVEHK